MTRSFGFIVAVALAGGAALLAQTGGAKPAVVPPGDWVTLNRDYAATRYSPLNQINTSNVARLVPAWTARNAAGGTAVPLVVNGVMFVANGANLRALDAETGKEIWSYSTTGQPVPPLPPPDAQPPAPAAGAPGGGRQGAGPGAAAGAAQAGAPAGPGAPGGAGAGGGRRGGGAPGGGRGRGAGGPTISARGVSYWPGDATHPAAIVFMTNNRMWQVNAATGQLVTTFGENGSIAVGQGWGGTPTIYRNVAVIGAGGTEIPFGNQSSNPRAFDLITGKKLWEFQTVPKRGEPFNDTWGAGAANGAERTVTINGKEVVQVRGGTNWWGLAAPIDTERGVIYMPIAGPAANYYGGDRPGANVFGNSIVAVDLETGKYRWHFQTVHHDLWDIDLPSAGALIDVVQDGRRSPAIAHVGKSSYFFVLNRDNGNPLIKVEERPVPKGDVPGEYYHPTQPFPVKPEPLSPTSFTLGTPSRPGETTIVRPEDTTPEHAAACRALMERSGGFINQGPFTPFMHKELGAPPKSTIQLPGGTGGVNWGGVAADPTTGIVYANAQTGSLTGWVEKVEFNVDPVTGARTPKIPNWPDSAGSDQEYNRAFYAAPSDNPTAGKGPFSTFSAAPRPGEPAMNCLRPPWGQLVAVNANTGDIVWRAVLGLNERLPEGKQLVGGSGSAGPTVTAGGLVFVGATSDQRFRAFDAKSGKELWVTRLPGTGNANPMTYTGRNGKQYVAIVSGGTVNVFTLP
jgi:quinoprotein glucose dehydrogenase